MNKHQVWLAYIKCYHMIEKYAPFASIFITKTSNKALLCSQLDNFYLKCIDWFRKINPAAGLQIYMVCTGWGFSEFLCDTSKLSQKILPNKLGFINNIFFQYKSYYDWFAAKWWLNTSLTERKQLLNYQLMVLLINWVLQQFKLCFFLDSVQAQWNLQQ